MTSEIEPVKPATTFSLAKALHYVHFAKEYFADVIRQEKLTGESKQFINNLIKRQEWVLRECYTRMNPEASQVLKDELEGRDIATIDSILNMVILMDEDKRLEVEDYIFDNYVSNNIKQSN